MSEPTVAIMDVKRGCGLLVEGGTYLSGAFDGADKVGGGLHKVVYPFGNGLDDVILCAESVPARGMLPINPAATFAFQSVVVGAADVVMDEATAVVYDDLKGKVLEIGLMDHVGSRHYSPHSFIEELREYGPNRRIKSDIARQIAPYVPLPVIFTHSQIPLFRNPEEIETALAICEAHIDGFEIATKYRGANWKRPEWGAFATQHNGSDHFMLPILGMIEKVRRQWAHLKGEQEWQDIRGFFDGLQYEEQPFAMSWFLKAIKIEGERPLLQKEADAGIELAKKYRGVL